MFAWIKTALLKSLLRMLLIIVIVGAVRYFQGASSVQFLGLENIYTVQPWIFVLLLLLLWFVWLWLRALLRGFFLNLPGAVSSVFRKGLAQRRDGHLYEGVAQMVRGDSAHALSNLGKYIKDTKDRRRAFHLWALGVQAFLSADDVASARTLFDVLKNNYQSEQTDDTTRMLLLVRVLLAEGKSRAAVSALLGAVARDTNNTALANELLALIESDKLDNTGQALLTECAIDEIPRKVRKSKAWQNLRDSQPSQ
ncbi:MAG: hypothetical protein K0U66_00125 [Gammaproteobacteria bacterium]|nr:hypothetical protein [Gammaproteobacteria bacterium]